MGCRPVLSPANGPVPARVMLVGEAPGRLGAGKTGVPFGGDVTGKRLERFMALAGLRRENVFKTNAVLCLPLNPRGNNRPPTRAEQANCLPWLAETIERVQPELVVAMGKVALSATEAIESHGLSLSDTGEPPRAWFGRMLAVTYHPGAQARMSRADAQQDEDWQRLGDWLRTAGIGLECAPGRAVERRLRA